MSRNSLAEWSPQWARNKLDDARQKLREGNLHQVFEPLRTATMWAIDSWLGERGLSSPGWEAMQGRFLDMAPPDLRSDVSYLLSSLVMLKYGGEGAKPLSAQTMHELCERAASILDRLLPAK